jgi:hypothetical protein
VGGVGIRLQIPPGRSGLLALQGHISVQTRFVSGSIETWVTREDVSEWIGVLSAIESGRDAVWREYGRDVPISVASDPMGDVWISVMDQDVHVSINIDFSPDWLQSARAAASDVLSLWPR